MAYRGELTTEQFMGLPPMLFGTIRWDRGLGVPSGGLCSGFRIVVEERTPTRMRNGPGGVPEPIPGTGVWRPLLASAPCLPAPDEGRDHVVRFRVPDVHLTELGGMYKVRPELTGRWETVHWWRIFLGFRRIDPIDERTKLTEADHIVNLDFRVVWQRRAPYWSTR